MVQGERQSTLLEYKLTRESCAPTLTDADLQPGWMVAKRPIAPDRKSIAFTLKPGIKRQIGHELTTAAIAYSLDRLLAIDPTGKFIFGTLGGFSKTEPITMACKYDFTINVDTFSEAAAAVLTFYWLQIHDAVDVKAHATPGDPWAKAYLANHISDFGP